MTTSKENNRSRSFSEYMQVKLRNPDFMREYINETLAHLEEDQAATPEDFLATLLGCLRDVVESNGGIGEFAKRIPEIHRTTLYKIFSTDEKQKNGPEFLTVIRILQALGLRLNVDKVA